MAERNPLDFPESARLADFPISVLRLFDTLPDGWVFVGAMRRAGIEYAVGPVDERWIAIATLESPTELGPIPEVRGTGEDMVAAVQDLTVKMLESLTPEGETAAF